MQRVLIIFALIISIFFGVILGRGLISHRGKQTVASDNIRYHIKKIYPKIQSLKVSGPFRVILTQGSINILTIYANENILKEINTELKEETLNISLTNKLKISANTPIKIVLQSDNVNDIFINAQTDSTAEIIKGKI